MGQWQQRSFFSRTPLKKKNRQKVDSKLEKNWCFVLFWRLRSILSLFGDSGRNSESLRKLTEKTPAKTNGYETEILPLGKSPFLGSASHWFLGGVLYANGLELKGQLIFRKGFLMVVDLQGIYIL